MQFIGEYGQESIRQAIFAKIVDICESDIQYRKYSLFDIAMTLDSILERNSKDIIEKLLYRKLPSIKLFLYVSIADLYLTQDEFVAGHDEALKDGFKLYQFTIEKDEESTWLVRLHVSPIS